MGSAKRDYTREEVHAILARAIERQHGELTTHAELLETAREAGVSLVAVEAAVRDIGSERAAQARAGQARERYRSAFFNHFFAYAVVIGFLCTVNLLTSTAYFWFVWPALAWAVGLAFHARASLFPSDERIAKLNARIARRNHTREKHQRVSPEPSLSEPLPHARIAAPAETEEEENEADLQDAAPRRLPRER